MMLGGLLMLLAVIDPCVAEQVLRPNYGVALQRHSGMVNGASEWTHTFVVEIPILKYFYPANVPRCQHSSHEKNNICYIYRNITRDQYTRHVHSWARLKLLLQAALHSIEPELLLNETVTSRLKRSPFDFISEAARQLFGVAVDSDVDQLKIHVNRAYKLSNLSYHSFQSLSTELSSFVRMSNLRFDDAMVKLKENHEYTTNLAANVFQLDDKITNLTLELHKSLEFVNIFTSNLHSLFIAQAEIEKFVTGIQTMLEGYLPNTLIEPEFLKSTLHHVSRKLSKENPSFELAHKNTPYYYQVKNIVYSKTDKFLIIAVKIPLHASNSFFEVYSIFSVPVPLNSTTMMSTLISDLPDFFAVTTTNDYYLELTTSMLSTCEGKAVKHCKTTYPVKSRHNPSCTMAIFLDDPKLVAKLCNIRFDIAALFEGALDLSEGRYLISTSENRLSLICHGLNPKPIAGCKFCVIKLPCACGIHASNFIIPPHISTCTRDDNITILHPINLPAVNAFYPNYDDFDKIFGNTLLHSQPKLQIPNFKFRNISLNHIAADSNSFDSRFKKVAESITANKEIFATKADFILSDSSPLLFSGFKTFLSVSCIPTVLSIVSLCVSIFAFYKSRLLAAAIHIPAVSANIVLKNHSVNLKPSLALANPQEIDNTTLAEPNSFAWIEIMTLTIVLACIAYKIAWFAKRTFHAKIASVSSSTDANHTELILCIHNRTQQCCQIKLLSIGQCTANLDLTNLEGPLSISYTINYFSAYLEFEWPCMTITDTQTNTRYTLPTSLRILPTKAYKLRNMIRNGYQSFLVIKHGLMSNAVTNKTTKVMTPSNTKISLDSSGKNAHQI